MRSYRRRVNQDLYENTPVSLRKDLDEIETKHVRRKILHKWKPRNLKIVVQGKLERRRHFRGWAIFKSAYNAELHREKFKEIMQILYSNDVFQKTAAAEFFDYYINQKEKVIRFEYAGEVHTSYEPVRRWLEAFFEDEPDYKSTIQQWIREALGGPQTSAKNKTPKGRETPAPEGTEVRGKSAFSRPLIRFLIARGPKAF